MKTDTVVTVATPAYNGPANQAHTALEPGQYTCTFAQDGAQWHATLKVHDRHNSSLFDLYTTPIGPVGATYRRNGGWWEGVVKQGKTVVGSCGHLHHNRDQSTARHGESARACADRLLNIVTGDPTAAAKAHGWYREG